MLDVGADQQTGDMKSIMRKHATFDRMIGNTLDTIEEHKRRKNFQIELATTNYISQQTMLELEIELDQWRREQLGSLDWTIKEFMFELEKVDEAQDGSFSERLQSQHADPKLYRQLSRLYQLHHSMQWSEHYKKITQQHISDEIDPYILYTAIRIGEHLIEANPRDSILLIGQESLSRL
ncbi:MAG: hypothetical protein H6765_10965 [Candidatus Peribacteria bacterium]|nr:MAG: hypothetical protein H6765_10965 [Candidatus Peribacteria bacterium]